MQGLRTELPLSKCSDHPDNQKLTHGDDIRPRVIHAPIILGCPFEADVCPGLEIGMVSGKAFPLRHEKLE